MMRLYRDRLELLVQTRDRVAFEERPHFFGGLLFTSFGVVMFAMTFRDRAVGQSAILADIIIGAILCAFGLLCLVRSTISAVRQPGVLEIRRQLGPVTVNKQYPFQDVARAFERRTLKGNGLRIELVDGRKKNLTIWTEYLSLSNEVGILNYFVHQGRIGSLERRVIEFTGEWFRRNFRLGSQLAFASNGVDATRFFEEFEVEFKVDLSQLREYWNLHFPQRHGAYFAWIVVVVASYFGGSYLHQLVQRCPTWIWTLLLATASGWSYWRLVPEKAVPITVSDLVDAARTGRWVRQYDVRQG